MFKSRNLPVFNTMKIKAKNIDSAFNKYISIIKKRNRNISEIEVINGIIEVNIHKK